MSYVTFDLAVPSATSVGLTMAGKIQNASEIKEEERTQAFDVYQTTLDAFNF